MAKRRQDRRRRKQDDVPYLAGIGLIDYFVLESKYGVAIVILLWLMVLMMWILFIMPTICDFDVGGRGCRLPVYRKLTAAASMAETSATPCGASSGWGTLASSSESSGRADRMVVELSALRIRQMTERRRYDYEPSAAGRFQQVMEAVPAAQLLSRVAERAGLNPDGARRTTETVLQTIAERIASGEVRDLIMWLPVELHGPLKRGLAESNGVARRPRWTASSYRSPSARESISSRRWRTPVCVRHVA